MSECTLGPDGLAALEIMRTLDLKIKAMTAAYDICRRQVEREMADATVATDETGRPAVRWSRGITRRLSSELARKKYGDDLADCYVESETRRFTVVALDEQ